MSDTPRTDEFERLFRIGFSTEYGDADIFIFARRLERELTEAKRVYKQAVEAQKMCYACGKYLTDNAAPGGEVKP